MKNFQGERIRNRRLGRGAQEGSKMLKRTGNRETLLRGLTERQLERVSMAGAAATSPLSPTGLSSQAVYHIGLDLVCELAEQNPEAWRALAAFVAQSAAGLGSRQDLWIALEGNLRVGNGASVYDAPAVAVTIPGKKLAEIAEGY